MQPGYYPQPQPMPMQPTQPMQPMQPVPPNSPNPSGSNKKRIIIPIILIIVVALAAIAVIFFAMQKNGGSQSGSDEDQPTAGMPGLVDDQILVGYDDKYFFVADTMNDTVRNAAKNFQLNSSNRYDDYKELTDIDAYLDELASYSYEDGIAYSKPPVETKNFIYMIYQLRDNTIEYSSATKRGELLSVVTITCMVDKFDFVLEGQTYTCLKTTEPEIEKFFGEIEVEEQAYGMPKASILYKNHWIDFYFVGDVINHITITPLKDQERKYAKYYLEYDKKKPSPSESIEISLYANTIVMTKNLGNYLYNINKEGCEISDLSNSKKETITNIFEFIEQPAKDNKANIGIKCDESRYLYVFGYANSNASNLKIKDLNAYTQTVFGLGSGFFDLDNKFRIEQTKTTRKEFEDMFVDYQVVQNTTNIYVVKYKGFFIKAIFANNNKNSDQILSQLTIYGGDLPTN